MTLGADIQADFLRLGRTSFPLVPASTTDRDNMVWWMNITLHSKAPESDNLDYSFRCATRILFGQRVKIGLPGFCLGCGWYPEPPVYQKLIRKVDCLFRLTNRPMTGYKNPFEFLQRGNTVNLSDPWSGAGCENNLTFPHFRLAKRLPIQSGCYSTGANLRVASLNVLTI